MNYRRSLVFSAVLAVLLIGSGKPGRCSPPDSSTPLSSVYRGSPSYTSALAGEFGSGIALVDLDRDGLVDMVVANGNDMSPQPLTVYYNQSDRSQQIFGPYPDWYSDDVAYRLGLAAGDVDGDGWIDVAVAVGMTHQRYTGTGWVEVFFNRGGRLEPRASYRTADRYLVSGCALGDVDADGDLDLVVPVLAEGVVPYAPPLKGAEPGRGRIYLNENGALERVPAWTTAEGIQAADAVVADVNGDGWMDVAFSALHTEVYYGAAPDAAVSVPIPSTPGWTSSNLHEFSYSLDVGAPGLPGASSPAEVPTHRIQMLAVSSSCVMPPCSNSHFFSYLPDPGQGELGRAPTWRSAEADFASKLLLADLNASGYLDLVADMWGAGYVGGPLWFFQGGAEGYTEAPDFQTKPERVGQGLAVADLKRSCVGPAFQEFVATDTVAVLTLPKRRIVGVKQVMRGGRGLAPSEYAWAPASNWISLARPLDAGESVVVEYERSPIKDLVEAVWQPQFGNDLYMSFLNLPGCQRKGTSQVQSSSPDARASPPAVESR